MRLLHLADLHIGKSLGRFSLLEEQEHILWQILDYVRAKGPDAVMIAGDVYDKSVPPTEAVSLLDRFLTQLAGLDTAVLLVAGNHDSPQRLSFGSHILRKQNLHLCGEFSGEIQRVTLEDAHGPVTFHLLPFVRPAWVRRHFPGRELSSYQEALAAILEATPPDPTGRNVLVAHQMVTSPAAEPVYSESETGPVGGLYGADAALLDAFDYVALGHLHGPQTVGRETCRYAGSPLKYSFSEWDHQKSAPWVELGQKGDVSVSLLPLSPLRDLRRLKGAFAQLTRPALAQAPEREDYLQVTLTDEGLLDAMNKLRAHYPRVVSLEFQNSRTAPREELVPPEAALSAAEHFERFFAQQNGRPMSRGQRETVQALLNELEGMV